MTAQIRGLNMAAKNAGDGLSMLSAIENATNDVTDMLQRMRELAVQAVNDTNTAQDRDYLQQEVTGLLAEINRVASQTQYNGENILDGSRSGKIQVGTEAGQTVDFAISSIKTDNLGREIIGGPMHDHGDGTQWSQPGNQGTLPSLQIGDKVFYQGSEVTVSEVVGDDGSTEWGLKFVDSDGNQVSGVDNYDSGLKVLSQNSLANIDVSTNPTDALATITAAIEQVAGDRAGYGALQNRLDYTVSNLMNVSEFTTAARSRIADADFAVESSRLAKAQVLQQSGTAMLAQANASSQLALSLIR
jgi:flagellin